MQLIIFVGGGGGPGTKKAFDFAKRVLESNVEDIIIDIPDINTKSVGKFDIVYFNGIIYHIKNPLFALEQMALIAKEVLVIETLLDNCNNPQPVMTFYPGAKNRLPKSVNGEHSGWGPNSLCMHELLKSYGFETILEYLTPNHDYNNPVTGRSIFLAFKPNNSYMGFILKNLKFNKPRLQPI